MYKIFVYQFSWMHCMLLECFFSLQPFSSLVNSYDGTIVVSFGSAFYSQLIPSLEKTLTETFSKFPQLILWKQTTSLTVPKNIHTFNWVPQNNLLGKISNNYNCMVTSRDIVILKAQPPAWCYTTKIPYSISLLRIAL